MARNRFFKMPGSMSITGFMPLYYGPVLREGTGGPTFGKITNHIV